MMCPIFFIRKNRYKFMFSKEFVETLGKHINTYNCVIKGCNFILFDI